MKTKSRHAWARRSTGGLLSMLLVTAAGACRVDATDEPSNARAEGLDRSTQPLSVGALKAANGTYGAGCVSRAGSWSVRISGSDPLANAGLSLVPGDTACVLTLTQLVADATYALAPSIALTGAYQGTAAAVASGSKAFYANAKLSATAPASDFVVSILYSDDPSAATNASVTAAYSSNAPTFPTLVTPASAASVAATPTLTATFNDPDTGDTGQLNFRVDTLSGCGATPIQSGSSAAGVATGASGSWTVGSTLTAGTYYWCAQGQDASGRQSSWTTSQSFTVAASGPSVVASSTAWINDTILTITKPAGTLSGMLMVAALANETNHTASLAGWTSIGHSTNSLTLDILYRVAGGAEPTSYTFSLTGHGRVAGGILTVSGANATPLDVTGASASSASAPSITTGVNNTLLVGCWANIASLSTPPATMTERWDLFADDKVAVACSTEARATAGATGVRTITGLGSNPSSRLFSIKP